MSAGTLPETAKKAAAFVRKAAAKAKSAARERPRRDTAALALLLLFLAAQYLTFPFAAVQRRPASLVVTDRKGVLMRGRLSSDGEWRLPVPLTEMGRWMPEAVVALEDRRFWSHNGADLLAILRAARLNHGENRVVSGGSTITSQVIRLSIGRERTMANKAREFWQAMTLELFMTKREILELYLNITPYGGNIRGVEAAALSWFGKQAKDLTLAEAALLAGILRSPTAYRPDRYPERARELRDRLIDTLEQRGTATAEEAARAKLEPIPTTKRPLPSFFAQAAARAESSSGAWGTADKYGRLKSTLDMDMQYLLQSELSGALSQMEDGVTAAAVLVENKTGAVRGYIGNAREGQKVDAAWVDCGAARRSPGSALKPFVYALAFESGELIPATMLADSAGSNEPRNFDRLHRGPVSARTALADSLNIPAVRVFRSQGGGKTLDLYRRLGFSHFTKDASWYGESLILGGCEVTALELARAYRALANGGIGAPLVWAEKSDKPHETRVLSEEAAALTLDVLKDARRLLPLYGELFGEEGTIIAFKTGTSYGRRDAWTAAVTPAYTLIIWFGDPAGRPHYQLVGITAAAQPAIRVMRKITPKGAEWFKLPKGVKKAELCPLSGRPRNPYCPLGVEEIYIEGVSRLDPCELHAFEQGNVIVKWPRELDDFFKRETAAAAPRQLKITSLRDGAVYYRDGGTDRLELSATGGRGELFWFIDGQYYDSSGPERDSPVFWAISAGRHKITAADESGKTAGVEITVRESRPGQGEDEELLEDLREL